MWIWITIINIIKGTLGTVDAWDAKHERWAVTMDLDGSRKKL